MLVEAAEKAGMKVPPDADSFDKKEFPHFDVFCYCQLARPMSPGAHWDNAKVIAKFTDKEIVKATVKDVIAAGWII